MDQLIQSHHLLACSKLTVKQEKIGSDAPNNLHLTFFFYLNRKLCDLVV